MRIGYKSRYKSLPCPLGKITRDTIVKTSLVRAIRIGIFLGIPTYINPVTSDEVGSSEDRLVVFQSYSRANNVKGGRRNTSTRTVEPDAPAGGGDQHKMHAAHACIP